MEPLHSTITNFAYVEPLTNEPRNRFYLSSHGKSELKNGNSVLAVGRANRVKEAFVFAGVDNGKVLDQGCWAASIF